MSTKISESSQNLAKTARREEELKNPSGISYAEIPGLTDPALDVINQLNANLKVLGELHQRLQFTLREVSSVIRN